MATTFSTLFKIKVSSLANGLIYYARGIPLIGSRIPESAYAGLRGKRAVAGVAFVLNILWAFLSKLLYVGLVVYLPAAQLKPSLSSAGTEQVFLHIFLLLSFFAACVSSASVLEPKREKYVAVKLMRMTPAAYMKSALSYRYVMFGVTYVPALLVFGTMAGLSPVQAAGLAVAVTGWRVLCEYLHLLWFRRTGQVIIRNNAIVWIAIGLACAAAFAPFALAGAPTVGQPLVWWPVVLVCAALGVAAALRLARYPDYRSAVDAATKRDDPLLNLGRMMADAQKSTVQTKESDYATVSAASVQTSAKAGYAGLNELFFARHRSLVASPVRKRLAIIAALGAAGALLATMNEQVAEAVRNFADVAVRYLAFAMFLLAVGERICRALFYNCDMSLMRYSFYRADAVRHYRIRLYRLVKLNALIAAALAAALTLVAVAAGVPFDRGLAMIWISTLALSVFFSVFHLLMYYIFQPYTTELNMKNPLYFIFTYVVSFACWLGILFKVSAPVFTIAVSALAVGLAVVSPLLVARYGRRTFRIK